MTAKELKIKEAWGDVFEGIKDCIDADGWCDPKISMTVIREDIDIRGSGRWRPSSLSGIEDNNGWISINSIEDLPTTEGSYFVYSKVYWGIGYRIDIFTGRLSNAVDHETGKPIFTYYHPIIKPKPPIY